KGDVGPGRRWVRLATPQHGRPQREQRQKGSEERTHGDDLPRNSYGVTYGSRSPTPADHPPVRRCQVQKPSTNASASQVITGVPGPRWPRPYRTKRARPKRRRATPTTAGASHPVPLAAAALPADPSRAETLIAIHHHGSDAHTAATTASRLRSLSFM